MDKLQERYLAVINQQAELVSAQQDKILSLEKELAKPPIDRATGGECYYALLCVESDDREQFNVYEGKSVQIYHGNESEVDQMVLEFASNGKVTVKTDWGRSLNVITPGLVAKVLLFPAVRYEFIKQNLKEDSNV